LGVPIPFNSEIIMKFFLALLAAVTMTVTPDARAQSSRGSGTLDRITLQGEDKGPYTPQLQASQIKETLRILENVDIRAIEVDVFIDVRNLLARAANGKADTDVLKVEFTPDQTVNLDLLLQRSKVSGADSVTVSSMRAALNKAATAPASKKK
jgi:hypothetical protein